MITNREIKKVFWWIIAASVALVIVPVIVGALVMVAIANLHVIGAMVGIVAYCYVSHPDAKTGCRFCRFCRFLWEYELPLL